MPTNQKHCIHHHLTKEFVVSVAMSSPHNLFWIPDKPLILMTNKLNFS